MIRTIALDHGDDPALRSLPDYQRQTLEAIASCGTAAAGIHAERCDHCADQRWVPNTCGHRSCPHCQGRERAAWVEARATELLPCRYFHVVLTLPPQLRLLADRHRRTVLDALLQAGPQAIDQCCRSPRFLGGLVGQMAILHTWTRDLRWHPHVHAVVTAGGWDAAHQRWIPARTYGRQRRPFLVPVDVLRVAYRRLLRSRLLAAYDQGAFGDDPDPSLASRWAFQHMLDRALAVPIVIRIEPPFGGPIQVLKYLGAYVSRTAVSPRRVDYDATAGTVTLHWRSNAEPDQARTTTESAVAFLQRFARHILPPHFQRIRFRGLWSTAQRARLHVVRAAMPTASAAPAVAAAPVPDPVGDPCTVCGVGHYQRVPGPVPRPPPRMRRMILAALRRGVRRMPGGAAICA